MQINKNNILNSENSGVSLVSIRDLKNTWVLRSVLFIIVVFSVGDSSFLDQDYTKLNNAEWADQWIANNNLNRTIFYTDDTQSNLFAQSNPETSDLNIQEVGRLTNSPFSESKESERIEKGNTNSHNFIQNNKQTGNYYFAMNITSSKDVSVLVQEFDNPEELVLVSNQAEFASVELKNENYYEQILQEAYQTSHENDLYNTGNKTKSVSWIAQGNIGPQVQNGTIQQPLGSSYANAIGIDNVSSEAVGQNQGTSGNAFMAMVNVGVTFKNGIEILSGVDYSQIAGTHQAAYDSEVSRTHSIFTSVLIPQSDGTVQSSTIEKKVTYTNYFSDTIRSNYRVSSIEIPLTLKYNFGNKKVNYFLSSGVSASIGSSYTSSFESVQVDNGHISETKYGMNAFNLLVGIGIQYTASPSVSIHLSPGYKYAIPVSDNSVYQSNVSSIGLFTGLSYYFR